MRGRRALILAGGSGEGREVVEDVGAESRALLFGHSKQNGHRASQVT